MFVRDDCPTIMDGWVVRYRLGGEQYNGEINASRNGVSISGRWPIMRHPANIMAVVDTIHKAEAHYIHLSGRGDPRPLDEDQVPVPDGELVQQGE